MVSTVFEFARQKFVCMGLRFYPGIELHILCYLTCCVLTKDVHWLYLKSHTLSSSDVIALPKCGANAQHIHELLGACFKVKLWKMKGKQEEESYHLCEFGGRKNSCDCL